VPRMAFIDTFLLRKQLLLQSNFYYKLLRK
jgi:hypothetical protein